MAEDSNKHEIQILQALYSSICSEMLWRHQERYRLNTPSLIITGALGTFFSLPEYIVNSDRKLFVLALAPFPYITIMGLILKEHLYINMRDWYFRDVLWPRLGELIFGKGQKLPWMVWHEFEARQLGREEGFEKRWRRFFVFMVLGAFDYSIPGIFALGGVIAYWQFHNPLCNSLLDIWANRIWLINTLFLGFMLGLIVLLRLQEQGLFAKVPESFKSEPPKSPR
jgi:hypothetical protein